MSTITDAIGRKLEELEAERDAAVALARTATAERDRARLLAAALEGIAAEAFQLLWQTVGEPASHAEEAALGRRVSRFLRTHAADSGPDRLPMPAGWGGSA